MTPSLNKFSPFLLASLADFPNSTTASWALNLTLTSQPVTRFAATNIPHLHLRHVTFIFPISLLHHDIVPTFLHRFMHRFPRLLMTHVSCLFYHPRLSLLAASSFLSLSVSFQIRPPSLLILLVPLYPPLIPRLFVRSRLVHVYIYIDPTYAPNLHPISCICPMFPLFSLILLLLLRNSCIICISGRGFSASRYKFLLSNTFCSRSTFMSTQLHFPLSDNSRSLQ